MSVWALFSIGAILAAAAPPLYFALSTRQTNPPFSTLSTLLVAALFVHAAFHGVSVVAGPGVLARAMETGSAALIMVFALMYWPLRRRG